MVRLPFLAIGVGSAVAVGVSVDIAINVAVDIDVGMIAAATTPVAIVGQPRAHGHAGTETEEGGSSHSARGVNWISVSRVGDRIAGVYHCRIVLRDIDYVRLGRLNLRDLVGHIDGVAFDHIRDNRFGDFDSLLRRSF